MTCRRSAPHRDGAAPGPASSMLTRGTTAEGTGRTCGGVGSGRGSLGVDRILDPIWPAPMEGRAVAVVVSCWRRLQVRWDRDAGRWFAFVLLACAVVCFNRL
jgi:hypothetical protein